MATFPVSCMGCTARAPGYLDTYLGNTRCLPGAWHRCCLQVAKTFRGLDRKAMTQVQPIESRPLLLALTDDGVNLHTLPGMQLKFQVGRWPV